MNSLNWLHVIALIKGGYEGDEFAHFGSILSFRDHVERALSLDLVHYSKVWQLGLTAEGVDFYERYRLAELPEGRATNWIATAEEILSVAADELERRATS